MKKRTRSGDSIGTAHLTGGYRAPDNVGFVIEVGDRVQVRHKFPGSRCAYGTWGTVEKRRPLGKVLVRLDDGLVINFDIHQLQFEKFGRAPLISAKAVNQ